MMKQTARKLDLYSVSNRTGMNLEYANSHLRRALEYLSEPERKKRDEAGECKFCFYLRGGRIGGAAITQKPCDVCGTEMSFSSTAVDAVCKPCGAKHKLCVTCGADVDLIQRRSRLATGLMP